MQFLPASNKFPLMPPTTKKIWLWDCQVGFLNLFFVVERGFQSGSQHPEIYPNKKGIKIKLYKEL